MNIHIVYIVIILIVIYYFNTSEHFATDIESVANVASLYNSGNFTATNMTVASQMTASDMTTTNMTVNGTFNLLPKGVIVAWSGSTPPAGWTLCDGQNGTPDLRGRFILGYGQGSGLSNRDLNATGGVETVTLTVDQMPSHTHQYWDTRNAVASGNTFASGAWNNNTVSPGPSAATGGSQAHENMPPFYVLAWIYKL